MPTNTFFNLDTEKKDNILEAAKKEFREKSFYEASINKIVKESRISRGSFYLYFENKEDLFLYLMQESRDNVLDKMTLKLDKNNSDVFDLTLLIFDYITSPEADDECKALIVANITKLDMNLILSCIKFEEKSKEIAVIKKFTNIDKLKIKDDQTLVFITELIFSSFVIEVINMLSKKNSIGESRKNLERKFEIIKNGILR